MNTAQQRVYIKGVLRAEAPFLFGSYGDERWDVAALRASDEPDALPYIPGSSLAGRLRALCADDTACAALFGDLLTDRERDSAHEPSAKTQQSALLFYDCFCAEPTSVRYGLRDGIALARGNRVAASRAKYEYEIVEAGARFAFRLELIVRDAAKAAGQYGLLDALLAHMRAGFYLGSKTNRGLGRFVLEEVPLMFLIDSRDPDAYDRYVNFDWETSPFVASASTEDTARLRGKTALAPLTVTFTDTLLIRDYRGNNPDTDFTMLKNAQGLPVIPGTSWGGLFRSGARRVLSELCDTEKTVDALMVQMYGDEHPDTVAHDAEKSQDAPRHASRVAFDESTVTGHRLVPLTRVKIDRFTQGAAEGALFSEEVVAGGQAELRVRYTGAWMLQLLGLVIADLNDGILALGGEVSVGRGLCGVDGLPETGTADLWHKIKQEEALVRG
jgi:CRISPR/Cas system CSM-associated protein Csm3 (group 7 of RAMP superfamily)